MDLPEILQVCMFMLFELQLGSFKGSPCCSSRPFFIHGQKAVLLDSACDYGHDKRTIL
jgi:hypothetical protein